MNFEEMLKSSGGFKGLFEILRDNGLSVELELEKFLQHESGLFSIAKFSITKMRDGYSELSFPNSHNISRHGGIVHGGIISYALDNAGGIAVMTKNQGIDQVTIDLNINFLKPLKKEPYIAIGRVLRHGRTISVAEAEIHDGEGVLCAKALGTWFLILEQRGEKES